MFVRVLIYQRTHTSKGYRLTADRPGGRKRGRLPQRVRNGIKFLHNGARGLDGGKSGGQGCQCSISRRRHARAALLRRAANALRM